MLSGKKKSPHILLEPEAAHQADTRPQTRTGGLLQCEAEKAARWEEAAKPLLCEGGPHPPDPECLCK